jgi:ribosomal protein L23
VEIIKSIFKVKVKRVDILESKLRTLNKRIKDGTTRPYRCNNIREIKIGENLNVSCFMLIL